MVTPAPARPEPLPLPPSGKHIGATPVEAGVEFRVWAPNATSAFVVGEAAGSSGRHELAKEDGGFFGGRIESARAGQRYRFELTTAAGPVAAARSPRTGDRWR